MNPLISYVSAEKILEKDYLLATYYLELPSEKDILAKAASFAVGQTVGTWVPVPGITDEMRDKHMGKVVNILEAPPVELSVKVPEQMSYFIQIAFPSANFNGDIPMLITTLLGNDASTSSQAKLVDLQFSHDYLSNTVGPTFGISGIRKLTGVTDRPLLLSMIKPCTGITPKAGANIFYKAAIGGVDIIKDDELLGNTDFSPIYDRVTEYRKAAQRAYEDSGNLCHYAVNVTGKSLVDNISAAMDAGAEMIMVNFAAAGLQALQIAAEHCKVPILGHYAGSGMYFEGQLNGISSPLICGKLPRMAGADMVVINTPYGGYPLRYSRYMMTVHHLTTSLGNVLPTFPVVGGGVHPGMSERYISELGTDIVLASGGAIHGHPDGAEAGAKAMRASIDAVMAGISLEDASESCAELKTALNLWGHYGNN